MIFERQMDGSKIGYETNGQCYLCASNGRKIFPEPFEELKHKFSRFHIGKRKGKWALLDTNGRVITPFIYSQILWLEADIFLCQAENWVVLNSWNIDLLKEGFTYLVCLSDGIAVFLKGKEYTFMNGHAKIFRRINFFNQDAEFNGADMALIQTEDGKRGLLKKNGEWYVEPTIPLPA